MSSPDPSRSEFDRRTEDRERRIAAAREPFEAARPFLHIERRDLLHRRAGAPVIERVVRASRAVQEWRYANNQRVQTDEIEILAVRIAADQFAREIEDAAVVANQDPATIAWVVAGLRCPRRPFCTGCSACFTVTSPHRADERFEEVGGSR